MENDESERRTKEVDAGCFTRFSVENNDRRRWNTGDRRCDLGEQISNALQFCEGPERGLLRKISFEQHSRFSLLRLWKPFLLLARSLRVCEKTVQNERTSLFDRPFNDDDPPTGHDHTHLHLDEKAQSDKHLLGPDTAKPRHALWNLSHATVL